MSNPEQRRGAVAAGADTPVGRAGGGAGGGARGGAGGGAGGPRRRRPWWAWLLLAIIAVIIVLAILLLAGRCGTDAGPGPAAGPAPGAGTPTGQAAGQPAPGAPGAAGPAPGGTPNGGAPNGGAGGASGGSGGTGSAGGTGDVAAVSARVQEILAASPVTFRPDSPELTEAGTRTVDRVARELAAAPGARVTVTGYAAAVSQGVGVAAQPLSDQRAAAVAQRLGAEGVDPARIQSRGAADTNPLASPAASRRVEIAVA